MESFSIDCYISREYTKGHCLAKPFSLLFLLDAEENGKNAVSKIFYLQEVFILIVGAEVVIVLFAHEIA